LAEAIRWTGVTVTAPRAATPLPSPVSVPALAGADQAARELDDALYYLRRGCRPCAQRHLDLALRHGATQEQVDALLAVAGTGTGETDAELARLSS
jgi:Carboxymuconolactone decarboxylase family